MRICVQRADFCACVALHIYTRMCVVLRVNDVLSEGVCISVEWAALYLMMCSAEQWQQNAAAVAGQLSAVQYSIAVPLQHGSSVATRTTLALFVAFVAGCGRVRTCVQGCGIKAGCILQGCGSMSVR